MGFRDCEVRAVQAGKGRLCFIVYIYQLIDVAQLFEKRPGKLLPAAKDSLIRTLENSRFDRMAALVGEQPRQVRVKSVLPYEMESPHLGIPQFDRPFRHLTLKGAKGKILFHAAAVLIGFSAVLYDHLPNTFVAQGYRGAAPANVYTGWPQSFIL